MEKPIKTKYTNAQVALLASVKLNKRLSTSTHTVLTDADIFLDFLNKNDKKP